MRKPILALFLVTALVLAACGGDEGAEEETTTTAVEDTSAPTTSEAGGDEETTTTAEAMEEAEDGEDSESAPLAEALGCRSVEVIVPYSPGGGSDQQVRRLQPAIEEQIGVSLNVNYQTGGDGSVGWNALANAEPDGCTIGNVVAPNIANLSIQGGDVGFTAEEMEYIAWTEFSPNMVGVAVDSEWESFDDFVAAAEAEPGGLTISGVGINGELLMGEVEAATGIDLTFVPVSGGVGDIIPQIAGGHIDAAISGFSLLEGDQVKPLVLSAPSERFPDVPTFEEAGYPDVKLVTSWGIGAPPGTPDEAIQMWNEVIQNALDDPDVQQAYEETGFTVLRQTPEEARAYFEEQYDATQTAIDALGG